MIGNPGRNKKGFTLIELMIVVAIMGILTPVIFRLYHEGVAKSDLELRESSETLRSAQVLFKHLGRDLRHARGLVDSFGKFRTDESTLIIKAVSPRERLRLRSKPGDLSADGPAAESDCVIVYRLDDSRRIVREVYCGRARPASSVHVLLKDAGTMAFTYDARAPRKASLVRLLLTRKPVNPDLRPIGSLFRIFSVG